MYVDFPKKILESRNSSAVLEVKSKQSCSFQLSLLGSGSGFCMFFGEEYLTLPSID